MSKSNLASRQMSLFGAEQRPADRAQKRLPSRRAPIPAPPRISATVTETLPEELLAAGWRIVWCTAKYADGWFYAVNDQLGQRTADHIYVKHRGFKYTIRDIAKGRTSPLQE